jgi:phospholipid/cholesterol/gamma-HCH transport system substrate-binding protein
MDNLKRSIVPGVIVVALLAAAFVMFRGGDQKTVTAIFPRTVALYEGSEVRVLGVPVGNVDKVEPQGTTVKVTMSYDADVDIPADADAIIISPSVVGDRYVQLSPVYSGSGPTLDDNAELDVDHTSTPLELDEIYQSLDDLTVALGPQGANNDGALSELLQSTAANFGGQGEKFNETLRNLSRLSATLENNKEELFGTGRKLEKFVSTLAKNDSVVRDFNNSMASVSQLLADEREELAASLNNLATALTDVHGFVKDNRDLLTENITGLRKVTDIVVRRRAEFEEILRVAPLALNNLGGTYNPQAGTLDTRANLGEILGQIQNDPALLLCTMVNQVDTSGTACDLINQILPRAATFGGAAVTTRHDPIFERLLEVAR